MTGNLTNDNDLGQSYSEYRVASAEDAAVRRLQSIVGTTELYPMPPASGQVIEVRPRGQRPPQAPPGMGTGTGGGVGAGDGQGEPATEPPARQEPLPLRALRGAGTVARNVGEIPGQIVGGALDGVREVFRAGDDLADVMNRVLPLSGAEPGDPNQPGRTIARNIPTVGGPETTTGTITREVSQFLFGFWRGAGLLKRAGVMQGAGTGAVAGRGLAAGAIADFFFNEADEANLANAWRDAGLPENALTDFLATRPDDDAALNRLRNAMTGTLTGAALEGVLATVRGARAARAARAGDAAPAAAAPEPATLIEAAGVPARPERDVMLVGDAGRPLVEVRARRAGSADERLQALHEEDIFAGAARRARPQARLMEGQEAVAAAPEARQRLLAYGLPPWLRGAPATDADLATREAAEAAGEAAGALDLVRAMRAGRVGPRGEVPFTSFLVREGGLRDQGGEISNIIDKPRNRPGLINNRAGPTLDRALERSVEEGYLPPGSTIRDLLDALDGDFGGAARLYGRTEDAAGRALAAAAADLDEVLGRAGLTINDSDEAIAAALRGPAREGAPRTLADLDAEIAARASGNGARLSVQEGDLFINWGRIQTAEDVQSVMRDMAESFRGQIDEARRGVQTNDETARLADAMGMRVEDILSRPRGEPWNAETALAARRLYTASGERLLEAARAAAAPGAGALEAVAFRRMMAVHYAIQAQVVAARTETARALQSWAIPAGSGREQMRAIEQMLEGSGGASTAAAMARRLAALGDNLPADQLAPALGAFTRRGAMAATLEAIQEVWINALLSSPTTHIVNVTSSAVNSFLQIAERAGAEGVAAMRGAAPGEGVMPGEAVALTYGMLTGFRDAMRLAVRTYRDESGELATMLGKVDAPRDPAVSAQAFGMDAGSGLGQAVDFLGHSVVRQPTRFIGAEDAFFKSGLFRMELHAASLREAYGRLAGRGEAVTPDALGREMAQIVRDPPEAVRIAAADAALYATFNRQAGPWARALLQARNSDSVGWNLGMSLILPFIRTPMNILSYSFERTPLAPLVGQWRADVAARGARRDLALTRMAMGSMMIAVAFDAAESGWITGRGPDDADERANWQRNGVTPYSVRVGDQWITYNRLDPFGFLLGFAGDMADMLRRADVEPEEVDEIQELMAAAAVTVSRAVLDRSWMSGASAFFSAFDESRPNPEQFISQVAGSLLVPAGAAMIERAVDPTARDAMGIEQAILARVVGLSERLIPRRNLWGEEARPGLRTIAGSETAANVFNAVTPVAVSPRRDSPIDREMVRLNLSIEPIGRSVGFADGGPSVQVGMRDFPRALDDLRRLAGNDLKLEQFGDLGLRDLLNETVEGRGPLAEAYSTGSDGEDGGRARLIRRVVQTYRDAAKREVLALHPDLRARAQERGAEIIERRMPVLQ